MANSEPFGETWMTSPSATVDIPAGPEGLDYLVSIDTAVPGRGHGRQNWHRERFCIVHLLRHLNQAKPGLFPAILTRQEAPDFVLVSRQSAGALAIEHTDAGSQIYQNWLDAIEQKTAERESEESTIALHPPTDGFAGDAAELAWRHDIRTAIGKKSRPTKWRHEPPGAVRCLVIYDLTETDIFISDAVAHSMAQESWGMDWIAPVKLSCLGIVRSGGRVVWSERSTDGTPIP